MSTLKTTIQVVEVEIRSRDTDSPRFVENANLTYNCSEIHR